MEKRRVTGARFIGKTITVVGEYPLPATPQEHIALNETLDRQIRLLDGHFGDGLTVSSIAMSEF